MNGNLSVSRAIGDAKQKHLVVGDADVEVFDLDGSEDYLVVACDGVWDVLNGEEIVKCVNTHLAHRCQLSKLYFKDKKPNPDHTQ